MKQKKQKKKYIERKANAASLLSRKPLYGIGIMDAPYIVNDVVGQEGQSCPYYIAWNNMFHRCYNVGTQDKNKTYVGSSVYKGWHSFMRFRYWMKRQDWEGKQLDKDIIVPGNKVYSPKRCCFLSHADNSLLGNHKASRGIYPQGVSLRTKHNGDKPFMSLCSVNAKYKYVGIFATVQETDFAYVNYKIKVIYAVAMRQPDPRVRDGFLKHIELMKQGYYDRYYDNVVML